MPIKWRFAGGPVVDRSVVVDSFLLLLSLYVGVMQYLVSFLVLTSSYECLLFYFVFLRCLHVAINVMYSKTCLKRPLKRKTKIVFKTDYILYRLMQDEPIAECSNWSILQYFRPSLSYHLSVRSLFCLF